LAVTGTVSSLPKSESRKVFPFFRFPRIRGGKRKKKRKNFLPPDCVFPFSVFGKAEKAEKAEKLQF
jgi:hypothetical protein